MSKWSRRFRIEVKCGRCGSVFIAESKSAKYCRNSSCSRQRVRNGPALRRMFTAHLRRKYGLSFEDYGLLLVEQTGRCAICLAQFDESISPCVDHCHYPGEGQHMPKSMSNEEKSKRVRGLLCYGCNSSLGHFGDSLDVLRRATEYLEKARNKREST